MRGGVSAKETDEYWGSRRLGEKMNDKTEGVSQLEKQVSTGTLRDQEKR